MTEEKTRKRAIRARMAKTGERYTAARQQLAKEPKLPASSRNVAHPGMSDEAVRSRSGKGWDEWFAILDAWGASRRTHTEIARHLQEQHGVSGWWAQAVTVGYERARGMRAVHQGPAGFSVTVSKTLPVEVVRLFDALVDARQRSRWLEPGTLRVRTAQPAKSARFDFRDGETRVHAYFTAKGQSKASVQLAHERLRDARAVEEMRAFWRERLARLAERLRS